MSAGRELSSGCSGSQSRAVHWAVSEPRETRHDRYSAERE